MSQVNRTSNPDLSQTMLNRDPLAQHLQLHPLVVMQYVYSRCGQMSAPYGDGFGGAAVRLSVRNGQERFPGGTHERGLGDQEKAVLVALIQLVDHLAETRTTPRRLFLLGYQLAASTDLWLGSLPAVASLYGQRRLLLLGIRQALYILLTVKFEYPLPETL
jgi:hypothetical protein